MNRMKFLTVVILILSIMTACGQNGLKEGGYFLLLKNTDKISLNTYESNTIKEKNTYPISEKSIFTTDRKERVAILDTAKNFITLYEIQTSKEIKLSIPQGIKPKTILLNKENLFVGGEMGEEILVQYHIPSEKWYQLEIPEEVSLFGKAVDDLVINDSLLIAIDNIILPKYVLFYHLNSTGKLEFSHSRPLKSNSTYEHIYQGRITPKYLGLNSTTVNHGNIYEHITIYADLDLTKSFAISAKVSQKGNFTDFLLFENKLFIANREKGLGIFEIEDSYFEDNKGKFNCSNRRISEDKVIYKQYINEEIIRLTKIPNEPKMILTIKNVRDEIRHEIMEI